MTSDLQKMSKQERQERIEEILDFCNRNKIRVTYGAAAGILEVVPRGIGKNYLGAKRPEVSWVVSKKDGKPTGYDSKHHHKELFKRSCVIETPEELREALQSNDFIPPGPPF